MTARFTTIRHERFTAVGKWASIVALLFVFSIDAKYRLNVAGLLVHPYLLLFPLAVLFGKFSLTEVPKRVAIPLFLFFLFFCLGSLQNVNPVNEILKVAAALFTFLFFAQSVRSEKDFRMISWGFLVVAVVIGVMGFLVGEETETGGRLGGINVLEGIGNKNAQSLFTLPGLFLSIHLVIHYLRAKRLFPLSVLGVSIFFITIQIFLSANRSGWVGLFVIFISYLVFYGVNLRTVFVSAVLVIFTYVAIDMYAADIFERKRVQTVEGYASDEGRQILMRESMLIGLENPVLGVGFDNLTRELAKRLDINRYGMDRIDTHFLFGYIFGATGIFALFFFLLFLARLVRRNLYVKDSPIVRKAWLLLICFVVLFVVRSLFTREILYSPTFMGGMGLVFGYYLMVSRHVINQSR
ncbi:MAG TPA: O-antigen ligase family protein [Cyclobacteriaceae bacterium]|nr:O-antigen ligase family protein [Cyclobacteriaceae bacterium]